MLNSFEIVNEKNYNDKLIKKTNALRAILDCSLNGIMAFDNFYDNGEIIDFVFTMSNKAACEIVNLKEEQLLGQRLSKMITGNFKPLDCLNGRALFDIYKEVVLTGESKSLEFYFESDGIKDWFRVMAVKYNHGFVCTFEIITQEKLFQEKLEKRVKEEVDKQHKQEKILIQQSKMAAMGEMIGAIAHNWRQPLNTISLLCVAMTTKFDKSEVNKDYLIKWTEKIDKQINFMSQTIDDFRNFYKPNEEFKNIFLKETITKIVSLVDSQFKVNHIQIKINIDKSISLICLENQLQQAIINILLNAKDAILNQNIEKGTVLISAKESNSSINLIIQDNGGGVKDKKILKRIFEPYFTTKIQSHGTGIGLYMTKIIIERNLGGNINVKDVNNGLIFDIELPLLII